LETKRLTLTLLAALMGNAPLPQARMSIQNDLNEEIDFG
jgi:hypothetical protein